MISHMPIYVPITYMYCYVASSGNTVNTQTNEYTKITRDDLCILVGTKRVTFQDPVLPSTRNTDVMMLVRTNTLIYIEKNTRPRLMKRIV